MSITFFEKKVLRKMYLSRRKWVDFEFRTKTIENSDRGKLIFLKNLPADKLVGPKIEMLNVSNEINHRFFLHKFLHEQLELFYMKKVVFFFKLGLFFPNFLHKNISIFLDKVLGQFGIYTGNPGIVVFPVWLKPPAEEIRTSIQSRLF